MAKIPRFFNANVIQAGTVGVRVDPGQQANLAARDPVDGEALQQAGQMMVQVAQEDEKRRESQYMNSDLVNFQVDAADQYDEQAQKAAASPEGFAQGYDEWFGERAQALLDAAPSVGSRDAMQAKIARMGGQYALRGRKHERGLLTTQRVMEVDKTSNRLLNRLSQRPEEFEAIATQLMGLSQSLSAEGVSSKTIIKNQRKTMTTARAIQLDGRIRQTPREVLAEIGEGAHNDLPRALLADITRKAADASEVITLKELYLSGAALDPGNKDHKKAADLVFDDVLASMKDEEGQINVPDTQFLGTMLNYISQGKGMMAPKLKSLLSASITNGNARTKELYSKLIVELDKNPETRPALSKLDEKIVHEAVYTTRLVESGTPVEQALETSRNSVREPVANDALKNRREILRTDKNLKIKGVLETIEDEFQGFFDAGALKNKGIAAEQYRRFYRDNFEKSGDADVSKELALKKLKLSFAQTEVNGEKELMEHAPNLIFPSHMEDFNKSLSSFMTDILGASKDGRKLVVDGVERKLKLKSTVSTAKDFGYGIFYTKELPDGSLVDVPALNEDTGMPIKFTYVPGPEQASEDNQKRFEMLRDIRNIRNKIYKEEIAAGGDKESAELKSSVESKKQFNDEFEDSLRKTP